jgi:hypothetical protein
MPFLWLNSVQRGTQAVQFGFAEVVNSPGASLPHGPERVRRFEQEARAAAALNHPKILAIFQMGNYQGALSLVSELLEGATLRPLSREKLPNGPTAQNTTQNTVYVRKFPSADLLSHWWGRMHD